MSVSTEQALKLADGNLMPLLGLGVWQVENSRQCVDAVQPCLLVAVLDERPSGERHQSRLAERIGPTSSTRLAKLRPRTVFW
jgi:hypothetical protein